MARKPKDPSKDRSVTILFTPDEYNILEGKAKKDDRPIASYIRCLLRKELKVFDLERPV